MGAVNSLTGGGYDQALGFAQQYGNSILGNSLMGDVGSPAGFQGYNMGGANQGYMGALGQQNTYNQDMSGMAGNAMNLYNQQSNNPYSGQMQQSANQLGGQMQGMGQNMMGMGNQLYQSGFDPQNQMYNQQLQQNNDQTNASLSQRGLADSGYGAGIASQSNQNFNTNWENQQLQRQLQGAQGAGQMYSQGAQMSGQGGQLPYQANQMIGQGQNQAMQNYYGNMSPLIAGQQSLGGQYGSYMGLGQGANAQAQQAAGQNSNPGLFGSVLGAAGSGFGGGVGKGLAAGLF